MSYIDNPCIVRTIYSGNFGHIQEQSAIFSHGQTYTFFYKHEGKFILASIMLSFLRISGSNYAYGMLNISFLTKS